MKKYITLNKKIEILSNQIKELYERFETPQDAINKVTFTRIKTPKCDGDMWRFDKIETEEEIVYVGKVGDKVKYIGWVDEETESESNTFFTNEVGEKVKCIRWEDEQHNAGGRK